MRGKLFFVKLFTSSCFSLQYSFIIIMNKVDYIEGIRQGKCEMNTDTTYKDL